MTIAGAGCCLIDYLYSNVSYQTEAILKYRSKKAGDGGIIPGGLVFAEDLEQFAGEPFSKISAALLEGREPDTFNFGGGGDCRFGRGRADC